VKSPGHKDESARLLELLEEAIHRSRRSRREIERSLGFGQGYLGSLFKGRIELKVWHVFTLARELGLEPLSLFLQVAPPQDPDWLLTLLDDRRGLKLLKARSGPPAMSREEVERLVVETLRRELERIAAERPEKDGEPDEPRWF
jgi:hypothetical protein